MLKTKLTAEIEFEKNDLPRNWQDYLKDFFQKLDQTMVAFGGESRKVITIKKIKIEEV